MYFSQRNGYRAIPEPLVPEQITDELRYRLWNVIDGCTNRDKLDEITTQLWHHLYKRPLDSRPIDAGFHYANYGRVWIEVREKFLTTTWDGVYDHIEVFVEGDSPYVPPELINVQLEEERAAYRVINGRVCQITDEHELAELATAMHESGQFDPVATHLASALDHFANRKNPDFRNSIKESIAAVESMAKIFSGDSKATLGQVLGKLQKAGQINGALASGFSAIYGWTSDSNGIRHALTDEATVDVTDAKFFLIACSAFTNYLKGRMT